MDVVGELEFDEFDGCGKCLVAVRRLSRVKDATSSPERQASQIRAAVKAYGGHIIAWADDWEVSGAVDPLTRPELGPWLCGEMGPYAGIVGAGVDRIGRDLGDAVATMRHMRDTGKDLVTYGHDGAWNLADVTDETRFTMEVFAAQLELRAIQKRNVDATKQAREAGRPKNKNVYGYRFVRLVPTGKVDHVEIDPSAAKVLRKVVERILSDESGTVTVNTEAVRLTREGVLAPKDHRAVMYGRASEGRPWDSKTLKAMLISPATMGFLMHQGRPVLGPDGHPVRLADPLWDRATHEALVAALSPKRKPDRAPRGVRLLAGRVFCGTCDHKLYMGRRTDGSLIYVCTARWRGVPTSQHCSPAPTMAAHLLEEIVTKRFLAKWGATPMMRREFDPGTGYAARIAELETDRARLREDRNAGLYDRDEDAAWFRAQYTRMGAEIDRLSALPDRPPAMRWVLTGENLADRWHGAPDDVARRDILAEYGVKVVLWPESARADRVWVHNLNPDMEDEAHAAIAAWEADRQEYAADATEAHAKADRVRDEYLSQIEAEHGRDSADQAARELTASNIDQDDAPEWPDEPDETY